MQAPQILTRIINNVAPIHEKKGVIVHTTANRSPTADDINHNKYYEQNSDRLTVHWTVDKDSAILSVEENRASWNAGMTSYNLEYISVEICENNVYQENGKDKLDQATYNNAVWIVADILFRHKWTVENMLQHREVPNRTWKNCPNKDLIDWTRFKNDVNAELQKRKTPPTPTPPPVAKPVYNWKHRGIDYLAENDLIDTPEDWKKNVDGPTPVWATMEILARLHEDILNRIKISK